MRTTRVCYFVSISLRICEFHVLQVSHVEEHKLPCLSESLKFKSGNGLQAFILTVVQQESCLPFASACIFRFVTFSEVLRRKALNYHTLISEAPHTFISVYQLDFAIASASARRLHLMDLSFSRPGSTYYSIGRLKAKIH